MVSVRPAGRVSVRDKNFNVGIFSDTIDMINNTFCIMVVLSELYPVTPLSVTLIVFQSHNSVKQSYLKKKKKREKKSSSD